MSAPKVIIYRYSSSPFARKIENLLMLRGIPYSQVNVPAVPPREALRALGIDYRRIPVVAIDGDVYVNTPLIAQALERAFPPSTNHPSVFPGQDGMLQLLWSNSYADRELFSFGAQSIPWSQVPLQLAQDRFGPMAGGPTPSPEFLKKLEARWPATRSALTTHLEHFELHLADGRNWLFSTETPSYADISAHMSLGWVRSMKSVNEVFDKATFPKTIAWLDRLDALIAAKKKTVKVTTINGDEAAKLILSASTLPPAAFDDVEAERLALKKDSIVSVTPDDTGKVPTIGKLVGLTRKEIVLHVAPAADASRGVTLHFSRGGFIVRPEKKQSKL